MVPCALQSKCYSDWGEREVACLRRMVLPGGVAVDVGANVGEFAIYLSRLVGSEGQVVAVEPNPVNVQSARMVLDWFRCGNVRIEQVALGSEVGVVPLSVPMVDGVWRDDLGRIVMPPGDGEALHTFDVKVETLDGLVERLKLRTLEFVKCDVEGAEWAVLEGGQQVFSRFRPAVLIEVWRRGTDRERVRSFFGSLEYTECVFTRGRLMPLAQVVDRNNPDSLNLIFLPDVGVT